LNLKLVFNSAFLILHSAFCFSQANPSLNQLNSYKYFVLKDDNSIAQYKDSIAKKVLRILNKCNFPTPLDPSVLYSNKFDQCQIITLVYSETSPTSSNGEINCSFKFVDCNYANIVSHEIHEKISFLNEKNYMKTLDKCFSTLDGFQYKYAKAGSRSTDDIATTDTKPAEETPQYRGNADPLKGLNVSKSKDMIIGKYYALIIGIDKYKGTWPPLKNAVADAKAIETSLSKYKFDVFHALYNEQATREKIIDEFEWLMANVKEQDNVFIYYSGHGEYKQEMNKGYWIPIDATTASTSNYVSNNDIQTFLTGIKSKHTLLVSDACFSGDIFRGNTVSVPFEESEKYYKEVHSRASRQAMTSGGIEPVMDGGKDGHSIFAYYFLKTLNENGGKYFDASQLYDKIKIPVINNSDQSPKLSPVKGTGDEGGQFIFIKK
jgi:caspase domain-containing protein